MANLNLVILIFATVAHKGTIRVFLSLVNYLGLKCAQVDIKEAFLNGDIEETIWLSPPGGSDIPADKVLLLRKSLYDLKQSPPCFNKAFDTWLKSQGLTPSQAAVRNVNNIDKKTRNKDKKWYENRWAKGNYALALVRGHSSWTYIPS